MPSLTDKAKAAEKDIASQLTAINRALDQFVASVGAGAPVVVRKSAGRVLGAVVKKTPVDTGRLRAGWTASARALRISLPIFGKGVKPAAVAEGAALSGFQEQKTPVSYQLTMANGVRYGPFIEVGHSKQARLGMVRVSLEEERRRLVAELGQIQTKGTK